MLFTRSSSAMALGVVLRQPDDVLDFRMRRLQKRDALFQHRIDIQRRGTTGGSADNSENARTRRSSDSTSSTTICAACSRNARFVSDASLPCARHHLFHGEPDRRKRVLDLVRHLARQHLPARELGQVDQPVAVLLELRGGVVERVRRASDLVVPHRPQSRASKFPASQFAAGPRSVAASAG